MTEVLPPPTEEELANPLWRIRNLYKIKAPDGAAIPFEPSLEQEEIFAAIYEEAWESTWIIKSRQVWGSTAIGILCIDTLLFGFGVQISLIDITNTAAKNKLDEKVKFVFENLDPQFQAGWEVLKDNEREWRIKHRGGGADSECVMYAGDRARGGTNLILWISEWGSIQVEYPIKSTEILTGALPTVEHPGCYLISETTWKGGRSGDMWPFIQAARRIAEAQKTRKDPRIIFIPWWKKKEYRDHGDPSQIRMETHAYFEEKTRLLGVAFDPAQRLWWQKASDKYGMLMGREYPTDIEECFNSPTEGQYLNPIGLKWQEEQIIPLSTQYKYGNIIVHGQEKLPIWRPLPNARGASIAVFEHPREGCSYIIPVDWRAMKMAVGATGERDANAISVIKSERVDANGKRHLAQVVAAILPGDQSNTSYTIQLLLGLYLYYGECCVVPETNNKDNVCEQMESAGITNIWAEQRGADGARPGSEKRADVQGWYTGIGPRRQMLDNLYEQVLQQQFICTFPWILEQFKTLIVNEHGKVEAAPGSHDDWVIAMAIGLFCISAATPYKSIGNRAKAEAGPGWSPEFHKLNPMDV